MPVREDKVSLSAKVLLGRPEKVGARVAGSENAATSRTGEVLLIIASFGYARQSQDIRVVLSETQPCFRYTDFSPTIGSRHQFKDAIDMLHAYVSDARYPAAHRFVTTASVSNSAGLTVNENVDIEVDVATPRMFPEVGKGILELMKRSAIEDVEVDDGDYFA